MFTNAKSVKLNGKEVKSIILENGAILYKKDEPYLLSVTSNKNILSYHDNDVATLTATLTRNGVPVQGEEIIFHTNKPIKETVIYSSGDTITLNEGEEIIIPKDAQFNIDTGTNGSGDYFHWNNGDFEYGNINGDITINSSGLGGTLTVPKVSGTLNTVSSVTIKKVNGEYIVEDSNSDLVVEYSPNYDNGTLTTNLEIELGGEIDTISLITNNNGIVTYQYNSQGIGDITFDISCMNLQETYVVEDCFFTHLSEETVNRSSSTVLTQEVVQNTQLTLPQKFEMSFKLKSSIKGYRTYLTPISNKSANDPNYALFLQQYSNLMTCGYRTSSTTGLIINRTIDGTVYHDWKVVRDGNSFKYYFDGVEVASTTIAWFDDYTPHTVVFNCWGTGSVSMKELKFKAL